MCPISLACERLGLEVSGTSRTRLCTQGAAFKKRGAMGRQSTVYKRSKVFRFQGFWDLILKNVVPFVGLLAYTEMYNMCWRVHAFYVYAYLSGPKHGVLRVSSVITRLDASNPTRVYQCARQIPHNHKPKP